MRDAARWPEQKAVRWSGVPTPQYENWLTFCLYQTERSTTEIKHYFSTWNGICFVFILNPEIDIIVLFVAGRFLISTVLNWLSQNYSPQIGPRASQATIYDALAKYILSWIYFTRQKLSFIIDIAFRFLFIKIIWL